MPKLVSTRRIAAAIILVALQLITAPQASAIVHLAPQRIFPVRADFVPIRTYAKWLYNSRPHEFACLSRIFDLESHWNPHAWNSTVVWMGGKPYHAGGIPQILGLSTRVDPYTQVRMGIAYIARRSEYRGSACRALEFHLAHGWY